ncbi:hypothetical protein ACPWSR_08010 [Alloiococcus sp. CFN-8]|uniref:hypothetical protein n=1 Tax=Alloiococcus sp. CFN-8 TaxID=3416081 RepID=UPI003CE9E1E5
MERDIMIKRLMEKADITTEEAVEVLESCNWDLLDAIIDLERRGKLRGNKSNTLIEAVPVEDYKNTYNQEEAKNQEYNAKAEGEEKKEESCGGIGELMGRMFKFIGKLIKKGNNNFFDAKKENEKPIRIPLTIAAVFIVFLSIPSIILLVIGLFCGYKYSISGPDIKCDGVNDIFEEVSKSADNLKRDFKEGYQK